MDNNLLRYQCYYFYQQINLKTAVQTIKVLQDLGFDISEHQIEKGLLSIVKNTGLLGRWQILSSNPITICDTAHNKEGLRYVMKQLVEQKFEKLHLVLGVVNDKSLETVFLLLIPFENFPSK